MIDTTHMRGDGWSNTYARAEEIAREWHDRMRQDGLVDIDLIVLHEPRVDGWRWEFGFQHRITGVIVTLRTHGIDDWRAYEKEHLLLPRTYWNDSSVSDPSLENWSAPGFAMAKTFIKAPPDREEP